MKRLRISADQFFAMPVIPPYVEVRTAEGGDAEIVGVHGVWRTWETVPQLGERYYKFYSALNRWRIVELYYRKRGEPQKGCVLEPAIRVKSRGKLT